MGLWPHPHPMIIDEIYSLYSRMGFTVSDAYRALFERLPVDQARLAMAAYTATNTRMFSDGGAIIYRFSRHATFEREGSEIIGALAQTAPPMHAAALLSHSRDEGRHALMFQALSDIMCDHLGFERVVPERIDTAPTIASFLSADSAWMDLACTIHVAEMRNYFILSDYLAAIERSSMVHRAKFLSAIRRVKADEIRHILSTAHLLEAALEAGDGYVEKAVANYTAYDQECWLEVGLMANYFSNNPPMPVSQ